MNVLLWGRAEYERHLPEFPEPLRAEVRVVHALGETAPLEEADVVVVPSRQPVRREHIPRLRRAKLVLTTTSGFDHVDVVGLQAAGIACARLPLARRDAVVQTALGMLLSLNRRFGPLQEPAARGHWDRSELPVYNPTLLGTVGVVGVGVIGSVMAAQLEHLGARVLRCDPLLRDSLPLDEVVRLADAITLHCELTDENEGFFDEKRIAAMRPGAVLVNTARGRLVDTNAALAAVSTRRLAGLGIDVFPTEPPPDFARFVGAGCIVTPHAAGWHPGLDAAIAEGIVRAVSAVHAGLPVPYALGVGPPSARGS